MLLSAFLISLGAILGALARWQLGVWLNGLVSFALGTWVANVLGCFFIGVAMGLNLNDSQKLLFITGFLGSFTTFSSFSAEVSGLFLAQKWLMGAAVFSLHTVCGITATILGVWIASLLR